MGIPSKLRYIGGIAISFGAGVFTGISVLGPNRSGDDVLAANHLEQHLQISRPNRRNPADPNARNAEGALHSKLSGSLPKGPNAIKEALGSLSTPNEMREEMTKLFDEAAYVASSSGDFSFLLNLFDAIGQQDRYILGCRLPAVFSKLGPGHDIREKMALLNKISVPKAQHDDIRRQIYQMEAMERYDEMKRQGVIERLPTSDFVDICKALGKVRLSKAFERVADGGTEEAQRSAAAALGIYAMQAGTMNGSKEISELPPGIVRDEAVAELVAWLRRTGSPEEAQPWLDTILDAKARERATR